ncbi:SOS response-associated peptidase [Mesorhizobium sp. CAU 1732]|uniref:SOS response-associated peptidase n=1 Tax=Mesorhizobium sp. CAU 1732 TaxID=3140358 RepID=UPI003260C446
MCGRFALIHKPEGLEDEFGLAGVEPFPPRYNIAPTQPILVCMAGPAREPGANIPSRQAFLARWGFIPGWAKDPSQMPLMINARSETASEKASFRNAMRHRRALIPASGFYEWKRFGKRQSQAYWVRPRDGRPVAFGALMETWSEPGGSEIDTAAILTTDANPEFASIHDRMPVVIKPENYERWLDCVTQEPRDVADLVQPVEEGFFEAIPVSDLVNKVANTSPEIQQRVALKDIPDEFVDTPDEPAQMKLF